MDFHFNKYFTHLNNIVRFITYGLIFIVLISVSVFVKANNNELNDIYSNQKVDSSYFNNIDHSEAIFEQIGKASYYGKKFHNRKTASGERFNMHDLTAAHRKLPFGSIVRVTNETTEDVTLVRINDRGPFTKGRILDLSHFAAKEINGLGLPKVKIEGFKKEYILKKYEALKDSYLAYSLYLPLEVIDKDFLHFSDSSKSFTDIVQLYYDYTQLDKETNWYICISAVSNSKEPIYYLTYPKEAFFFARMNKD